MAISGKVIGKIISNQNKTGSRSDDPVSEIVRSHFSLLHISSDYLVSPMIYKRRVDEPLPISHGTIATGWWRGSIINQLYRGYLFWPHEKQWYHRTISSAYLRLIVSREISLQLLLLMLFNSWKLLNLKLIIIFICMYLTYI